MTCITIEVGGDFTIEDLWPDGDAPETVDAKAVVALIKQCGGLRNIVRDCGLARHADVTVVAPNPHWRGDNVLFGDPPPRWIVTQAEAT